MSDEKTGRWRETSEPMLDVILGACELLYNYIPHGSHQFRNGIFADGSAAL